MNPLALAPEAIPVLMSRLTPRQLEIVGLLAQGYSNKQVASILGIRRVTIQAHIYNACHRCNVKNKTQLIVAFVENRIRNMIE